MKRKILILIAIPFLTLLSGCNKDYLDKNPLDQISTPTYWKSKTDFDNALTACYGVMTNQYTNQEETFTLDIPIYDGFTDMAYSWAGFLQNQQEIAKGQITSTTGGFQSNIYKVAYMNIARFNAFLQQLDAYSGTDISENDRAKYKAEVLFLRAWHYFQLWNFYGDVPLILVPLDLTTQNQPKATAAQVLDQIIKDLDYGITNGITEPYYKNSGHAGKAASQALKARVLLYDATTNGAYHAGGIAPDVSKITIVRDLCKGVMENSGHSLSPIFENVFRQSTQANNPEIIWSTIFLEPNTTVFTDLFYADWYTCSPLPSFVREFENIDGTMPTGTAVPYSDALTNRDPRLYATFFNNNHGNKIIDWEYEGDFTHTYVPSNSNQGGYGGVRKFCTPENVPYDWGSKSGQDWVHIRFAEVLLMYAEAQNELAGPDASVYDAMNSIRTRLAYTGAKVLATLPAGLSKEQMREKIRHERKIELAFEGFRYYDLKRWGIAGDILNTTNISTVENLGIALKWEDKFYKWPLPQGEIDKSKGILIQNPDYK